MTPNEMFKHEQTLHRMYRDFDLDAWKFDAKIYGVLASIEKAYNRIAEMRRSIEVDA